MRIIIDIPDKEYDSFEIACLEANKYADGVGKYTTYSDIRVVTDKILNKYKNRRKPERNKLLYEMFQSGSSIIDLADTFGITVQRAQQIYHEECARRSAEAKTEELKKKNQYDFLMCLQDACELTGVYHNYVTRSYNILYRAGIIPKIEKHEASLDDYSDEELLSLRGFGLAQLDLCRCANALYFERSKK